MGKLSFLQKLAQEASTVKPLVKQGGRLISDNQLAQGQKVVEKLPSSQEYLDKMASLKKAAGAAGLVGGASLMTPDEANAAGIETIARKLGVGLEEAAKIKDLAKSKVSPDIFEENIRAIQEVAGYKKNPELYKKLGNGVDYRALETPSGKVLKEPKEFTEDRDILKIAPSLVEQAGLGPKTKIIPLGERYAPYMVQDKVTPLNTIVKKSQRPGQDPELESLYKQSDALWKKVDIHDPAQLKAINESPEYLKLQDDIQNRQNAILKEHGVDVENLQSQYRSLSPDEKGQVGLFSGNNLIKSDPENAFEKLIEVKARQKLGNVIKPVDLHSGNVGLDSAGNDTIFDTSRFKDFNPYYASPEQKSAIEAANIALPEKKAALQRLLNPDNMKKAAAIAPAMNLSDSLGQLGEAYSAVRQPVLDATSKVGEFVADTVRPPFGQSPEQMQRERNIAGGISSMALDPANYVAPGLGMAVGAADVASDSASSNQYPSLMELFKGPKKPINPEDEEQPLPPTLRRN